VFHFEVVPLRERGRLVPRWQFGRVMKCGQLEVHEVHDAALRRIVRVATLRAASVDLLPPLRDVSLIAISGPRMTLTGIEAVPGSIDVDVGAGTLYQQSWLLIAISEADATAWLQRERAAGRC
jgi:hypothetical protein